MTDFFNKWTPYGLNGRYGYIFDGISGLTVVLTLICEQTDQKIESNSPPPRDSIKSAAIRLMSSEKNVCLAETVFPPAGDNTVYPDVTGAAMRFSLLYAAKYFQQCAENCLEIYKNAE